MNVDALKDRDFYVVIDKSGSMEERDTASGQSRWSYCQESVIAIARTIQEYDPDGITIVPFSGTFRVYHNVTADKVKDIFQENSPMGGTNLGPALQVCFDDYLKAKKSGTTKSNGAMMVVITDGQPHDEQVIAKAIVSFTKHMDVDEEFGISILQVGRDSAASAFLRRLDDNLQKEGAKFDIVDTKTMDDLENVGLTEALLAALTD